MYRIRKVVAIVLVVMLLLGATDCGNIDVWAAANIAITEMNFPDQAFRGYVEKFDKNSDGYLSEEEIELATTIDVAEMGIRSLRGVEYFSALRNLSCENNQLISINISANTALEYLDCSNNQLSSLNINNNTALTSLYCQQNQLANLDISNNTHLVVLNCSENDLMTLDVTKNVSLNSLNCERNHLSQLNLRSNTKLITLSCGYNRLMCLDLSNCSGTDLSVNADSNVYNIGKVGDEGFTLDTLSVMGFNSGNAVNWKGATVRNGVLTEFTDNIITYSYNCGKNIVVTFTFTVGGARLDEDEFPDKNLREALQVYDLNDDGALSEEECNAVTRLNVSGLGICDLTGIAYFQVLQELYCNNNQLTSLDLYGNPELMVLWCNDNQLTSLNVSNNAKLETLYCYRNQLNSVDVTQNMQLGSLNCSSNPLTTLNVQNNSQLTQLNCSDTQLVNLDVSGNPALEYLNCANNQLICLELSNCQNLRQENVVAEGNSYDIGTVNIKGYTLNQLSGNGFDAERTSNWTGAVYESGVIGEFSGNTVTYSYDCGNGITTDFTLTIAEFTHTHEYRKVVTAPTCTEQGYTTYTCSYCGESYRADYTNALGHNYRTTVVPATTTKSGYTASVCSRCGAIANKVTIYPVKSITLAASTYVYNGQKKKPAVTVKDSKGNRIGAKYYTVTYTDNLKVGTATVTVKMKGNYSGTLTKTFSIKPPASKITSLTAKSKGFKVYWQKQPRQITGYQIAYSTGKKFSAKTTVTVKINKIGTTYKSISKLKKKKKYYVRIRTYANVTVNGKVTTLYSTWSAAKTVTTK